ncbi:hypothetical protein B0T17DRAFT_519852 [Bombardia bombarda]|uniref:Uncharacterized protein n=1 Tax=Bombardia bombarda TaxID=252184 RepID=A0AA40CFD4_9PEZI|nr:hypothetical protein B0T17DRAFT_519852 [Bombardia bombarda]
MVIDKRVDTLVLHRPLPDPVLTRLARIGFQFHHPSSHPDTLPSASICPALTF